MEFLLQLFLVLFLVFLNGFFVASEFALVGIRRTRIQELVSKNNALAGMVSKALDDLETYISATQLGITLASLALGWVGEPAIAHFLKPLFSFLPQTTALITAHSLAIIIAFTLISILHIVLGELAPKSIALQRTEKTSLFIITPLTFFVKVFKPAIWFLNFLGEHVVKLVGLSESASHTLHSEEEIKIILNQSREGGVIEQGEVEMVQNVFRLADIPITDVMVPRTNVIAYTNNITVSELLKKIKHDLHSRYPIYEGSLDSLVGFIHIKDIYQFALEKKDLNKRLKDTTFIRETITVPETKKADDVLRDMRKYQVHMIFVSDEYGGTAGVVSLEDILESVVGEIEDEFDRPTKAVQKQADGSYLIDGMLPVEKVRKRFNLPGGSGYATMGGLLFSLLGREPRVGDKVTVGEVNLEVAVRDKKRIALIRLTPEIQPKS